MSFGKTRELGDVITQIKTRFWSVKKFSAEKLPPTETSHRLDATQTETDHNLQGSSVAHSSAKNLELFSKI